jgi:hypothetical protein
VSDGATLRGVLCALWREEGKMSLMKGVHARILATVRPRPRCCEQRTRDSFRGNTCVRDTPLAGYPQVPSSVLMITVYETVKRLSVKE